MNRQLSIRVLPRGRLVFGLGLLSLFFSFAQAQALRDPTQPPVTETSTVPGATSSAAPLVQPGGMGQKVGQARIERISETEVWLREAGVVRKVQVFGGIQRQASKPIPTASRLSSFSPSVAQSKP